MHRSSAAATAAAAAAAHHGGPAGAWGGLRGRGHMACLRCTADILHRDPGPAQGAQGLP